jgi:NtrC-family two-component system sensor histidine kinase KinB
MRRLYARFVLAGCLVVAATVCTGLWAGVTFASLSAAAAEALGEGREKIDLTAELAAALEREDDALLLALSGGPGAEQDLADARRRVDRGLGRLADAPAADELRDDLGRYRAAGAGLLRQAGRPDVLACYHRQVNPLLRRAVADCARLREAAIDSLGVAGARARDQARRATWIVAVLSLAAVAAASAVSVWLTRSVVRPVRELTDGVEALRLGDFGRRVAPAPIDELGRLADGVNRLAETLAEYRASSLGELLAAKATLEATLDALPDAVLVVAPDGTLAALNPPARSFLAAKGAAAAGRLRDLPLPPEHLAAVESALAGRASTPPRADFGSALAADLDGRPRRFLLSAVPVPGLAPRGCGAVLVLDDVTDFARLDELRSELIGVASHELKTPLTTLRMNLRLLGEGADELSARQREMVEAALGGCEELAGTIEELLDVARIEAGQLRLDLAPVDLERVLEQALRPLRVRFEDAGVAVRVARDGRPALARGDAARLRAVLTNLLTNALKYSPPGGTVTVRLSSGPNAGPRGDAAVQIAVADQGPGVPAEYRERVFEKFFRVEHHLGRGADGQRGTGIGLYLCREIVKAHGGSIRCEAGEDGVGARVAFVLPADAAEGARAQPAGPLTH